MKNEFLHQSIHKFFIFIRPLIDLLTVIIQELSIHKGGEFQIGELKMNVVTTLLFLRILSPALLDPISAGIVNKGNWEEHIL